MTPPEPHAPEELVALLGAARTVAVGHGRDAASTAAAKAFVQAWEASGGEVLAVVSWPERAASWLRQARRLTERAPDAWVVAGAEPGWTRMSRRLRESTDWDPERTFGLARSAQATE
ncbi:hypothetical protein [Actinomadura sp. 9N407]|uniref:hypothetical protein n=1 Tax=Actinomadura sp. 9N407 TaxID=3375154 RepID=UPI0037B1E9F4